MSEFSHTPFHSAAWGEPTCLVICLYCGTGHPFPIPRGGRSAITDWKAKHVCPRPSERTETRDTEQSPPPESEGE